MGQERLKIVVTGHIDHGKSTFIGKLLYDTKSLPDDKIEEIRKVCMDKNEPFQYCYLLDYLMEEREKKITIDTTHIYFKHNEREYVIIDAPGHTEFVKNMVTGASQAEQAFIILDVKAGNQEQTRRHASILSFLGFDTIYVLVNKMDLIEYSQEKYEERLKEFQEFASKLKLKIGGAIPISAIDGDNIVERSDKMPWYHGDTVMETLEKLSKKEKQEGDSFVFEVQDILNRYGKELALGRVTTGTMREGENAYIYPGKEPCKVEAIYGLGQAVSVVGEAECASIKCSKAGMTRGNIVLSDASEAIETCSLYVSLFWIAEKSCKVDETLEFRCLTQSSKATLVEIQSKMDSSTLQLLTERKDVITPLSIAKARLELKTPCCVSKTNHQLRRFVLMRDNMICGGGIITDCSPINRRNR